MPAAPRPRTYWMVSRRRDEEPGPMLANRKLKQRRRRQIQKRCLKLHRTYSISFNSSNVGKLFRCCILKDCIEVLGNKKKVVRHFHVVVMQRRQRNVQKSVMHVQSCCFIFLNFCFFAVLVAVVVAPYCVCIKGVKRSWATDVNRKWGLFPLHMPWRYKICTPLLLYSYRDDLTENLGETTAQECKSPLPVDVHRSKTPLLKAPNVFIEFIPPPSGSVHVYHWFCGARRESRPPFQLFVVQTEDPEFS